MQQKEIDDILNSIKAPFYHPLFYPRVFALVAKQLRKKRRQTADSFCHLVAEEYEGLSRRLDRSQIQESCSVRNVLRTRRLAQLLIDANGAFNLEILPKIITYCKEHLYSLGPHRQHDAKRQEHILKVLQLLDQQKQWIRFIQSFTRPISNQWAEELIRQTLQLPSHTVVTDAHTRQAVLAAWLCYLRQNVGSCFATAPAEIIHDEQPELFLQDLLDLMSTGRLKRTFGGVENVVPLSASWGSGDLKKPLVMRLASKGITPEIWHSPGLMAAFEAMGFLKKEERLKQKTQQMESWIKPLIRRNFSILTAEEIIRTLLLQQLGLTDKQIKEYEKRPRDTMSNHLMVQTSLVTNRQGGIEERCKQFFHLLEIGKNAFKSFADNALLKAWEFTLASFSDIKYEFARWNFYASLGLGTNEPGGIGECIYQIIQHKLDVANRKAQDIQLEYEMVYTQVKTLEARMRHASTEEEAKWLKVEYQTHLNEFYFLEEQRNEAQSQAAALVNLYDSLYKLYVDLFKDYFQEVYDADMQEVTTGPFDDSPAGFRLLYKHGRSNPSQWTRIENHRDFIESLVAFFAATESQIAHLLNEKAIEKDLSDVVTAVITHIRTKEFLESALHRMASAHQAPLVKDPLDHLDRIEKKPWVYTSGGTMNTLVSCYYLLEEQPKEVEKWVESEMELLVYLADTLKQMPPRFLEGYLKGKRSSMLMQSPTHAFLLKPMLSPFKETWSLDEFTYTSIRDRFVRPAEMFVERLLLNDHMLQFLVQRLSEKIPQHAVVRFKAALNPMRGPLNPIFFRDFLVHQLKYELGGHPLLASEEIDSFLYTMLPLVSANDLREHLHQILVRLPALKLEKVHAILRLFDEMSPFKGEQMYLGTQQMQELCKALLCLSDMRTATPHDYALSISLAAQELGLAMPTPLIFADTNWVKEMFGFVVNPGTGKLELWRLDYTGSNGYPMSSWKQWVNGSRPDRRWGVYTHPFQYGQV